MKEYESAWLLYSGDRDWPRDEAGRTRGKMKHKEGSGSCFE